MMPALAIVGLLAVVSPPIVARLAGEWPAALPRPDCKRGHR